MMIFNNSEDQGITKKIKSIIIKTGVKNKIIFSYYYRKIFITNNAEQGYFFIMFFVLSPITPTQMWKLLTYR